MKITHKFVTGQADNGKWLAISPCAPYFCLEADSEAAAEAIAGRALDFYYGVSDGRIIRSKPEGRQKKLSTFLPHRTVEKEFAGADR